MATSTSTPAAVILTAPLPTDRDEAASVLTAAALDVEAAAQPNRITAGYLRLAASIVRPNARPALVAA